MSILDPNYDHELHFSDFVDIKSVEWNPAFFDINKISKLQADTHMVDGTFEDSFQELQRELIDNEVITYRENVCGVLWRAISKYMVGVDLHDSRHIYMPDLIEHHGELVFSIWDEYQREYAYTLKFSTGSLNY